MDTNIVRFYLGEGPDDRGRTIDEILAWDDTKLEGVHDFMQWLFPLSVPSNFNPNAPLVNTWIAEEFRCNPALQEKLLEAFRRMMLFYGFDCHSNGETIVVMRTDAFAERSANWLTPSNHNHLRISRILTSMRLLGQTKWADAFRKMLEGVYTVHAHTIGEETLGYWRLA